MAKLGGTFGKLVGAVTEPIKKYVTAPIGKAVSGLTEGIKEATGFKTTPVPDSALRQVDQGKAAALAQYGQGAMQRARETPQPGQYRSGTFAPQNIQGGMAPASTIDTSRIQAPTQQYQQPNAMSAQKLAGYSQAVQGPQIAMTGQAPEARRSESGRSIGLQGEQEQRFNPNQMEASQKQLQLTREGGNVVKLSRPGEISANTGFYQGNTDRAITTAANRLDAPLREGYNSRGEMDQYVNLQRVKADKEKNAAIARLKEEQMAAGNYGSSVGQKQIADLEERYAAQNAELENQMYMKDMEAQRQDRYSNEAINQQRIADLARYAGAGQSQAIGAAQFGREGAGQSNAAQLQEAQFNQGARGIDRASEMAEFESQRQGRAIDEQRRAAFDAQNLNARNINRGVAAQEAQFGREGRNIDYASGMDIGGFNQGATGFNNAAALALAQYQAGENQRQFGNTLQAQQFGFNTEQQGFQNQFNQGQQGFQNQITAGTFNRQGQQLADDAAWQRYLEDQRIREANLGRQDAAFQYNDANARADYDTNYRRYRDTVGDLASYASGSAFTPESEIAAQRYEMEQGAAQAKQNAFLGAVGQVAGAFAGRGSSRAQAPAGNDVGPYPIAKGNLPSPSVPRSSVRQQPVEKLATYGRRVSRR